jgi:hypothetical protein
MNGKYRFAPIPPVIMPLEAGVRALNYDLVEECLDEACDLAERLLGVELEDAVGLYVFALTPPGRSNPAPYYVGKAHKQSLPNRAIRNRDKKGLYDTILQKCGYSRGTPSMTFLPLLTRSGRLAKLGTNESTIREGEWALIGAARTANPDLWNIQANADSEFEIGGMTEIDRRIPGEKALALMLGN